eukprot:105484-Rhodomonas_salina.1
MACLQDTAFEPWHHDVLRLLRVRLGPTSSDCSRGGHSVTVLLNSVVLVDRAHRARIVSGSVQPEDYRSLVE